MGIVAVQGRLKALPRQPRSGSTRFGPDQRNTAPHWGAAKRAGAIVTDRDVQRAQLVKRGDVVQILVKKGAITARSTAIAAQDGFLGDRVRVELPPDACMAMAPDA